MSNLLYNNYTTSHLGGTERVRQDCESKLRNFKKHFLPHLPQNQQAQILDCGCGYGATIVGLEKAGYKNTIGIDISEEQIATGRSLFGLKNIEVADVFSFLNAGQRKFDVILLLDVLEHIETEKSIELLRLIHNQLNVGGRLILQMPNGLTPLSPYFFGDITHKRAYIPQSLSQSLRLAGFDTFAICPAHPFPYGFRSFFRTLIWRLIIEPLIAFICLIIYGQTLGRVYTPNIIGVAIKNNEIPYR